MKYILQAGFGNEFSPVGFTENLSLTSKSKSKKGKSLGPTAIPFGGRVEFLHKENQKHPGRSSYMFADLNFVKAQGNVSPYYEITETNGLSGQTMKRNGTLGAIGFGQSKDLNDDWKLRIETAFTYAFSPKVQIKNYKLFEDGGYKSSTLFLRYNAAHIRPGIGLTRSFGAIAFDTTFNTYVGFENYSQPDIQNTALDREEDFNPLATSRSPVWGKSLTAGIRLDW